MADRRYKLGSRRREIGKGDARMSTSRWAWLKCNLGQVIIMVDPTDENDHDIRVLLPMGNGRNVTQSLTGLTEEELLAYRELINTACDWALPIVRERDANARRAFEEGDDSYPRSYRPAPQLVYRKGLQREDWESVRERPAGTAGVEPVLVDPNAGLPSGSREVSERDTQGEVSEDD